MPRSPSRDRSDRFGGNRGYFHRPTRIARAKHMLSLAALLVAGLWVVADIAFPEQAVLAHTHGPVASAHAHWEDDCTACHRPHSPGEFTPSSIFAARDRWHDLSCQKCHAGPTHVAAMTDADRAAEERCSNCHHEHGGRLNSLVRISDDHCTRCHANLAPHHTSGSPGRAGTITSFVHDHPEFRPLQSQPTRTLKFSHALHMTPGQVSTLGGRDAMTVDRLRKLGGEEAVKRYSLPGRQDGDLITLGCSSCHQLDADAGTPGFAATRELLAKAGEPNRAVLPSRAEGAHFLPVNFEMHCRACHPLSAPAGASADRVIPGFSVPHRRQPAELTGELQAGYLRGLLAADHPALASSARPGGALDPQHANASRTLRAETERLVKDARDALLSGSAGCAKCHDVESGEVAPVPDRTVWFPAARFNHASHRATSCVSCHPGTTGAVVREGEALVEKESVRILGIESCRMCHSPTGTRVNLDDGSTLVGGGARFGCVDCHRYHDADHGLRGRGARLRRPDRPLDLAEFLRGAGK